MKFGLEHIGKQIVVNNTEGADWLKKGSTYTINKVYNHTKVMFKEVDNLWTSIKENSWTLVYNEVQKLKEGDEVIMAKETTSLKKGVKTKVKGFVDGDERKLIVEGVIPGGWIRPENVIKVINLEKYRMKKAIELVRDFGFKFTDMFDLNHALYFMFGKKLSDLQVIQQSDTLLMTEPQHFYISSELYTDQPYEPLDLKILNKEAIKPYSNGLATQEIEEILGKSYSEINKDFDPDNDKAIMILCKEFEKKSYLKNKQTALMKEAFKVVKKQDNEQAQPALPF